MAENEAGILWPLLSVQLPDGYCDLVIVQGGTEHSHAFILEPSAVRFCVVSQNRGGGSFFLQQYSVYHIGLVYKIRALILIASVSPLAVGVTVQMVQL